MLRILAIETSCDETAISIVELAEVADKIDVKLLTHLVSSQIDMHKEWGGVVPSIARREHQRALTPLLAKALEESKLSTKSEAPNPRQIPNFKLEILNEILAREPNLLTACTEFLPTIAIPEIDAIAVTAGPGLEPALWVGLSFAKALSLVWQKPLIPVNHMEGHILSSLLERTADGAELHKPAFPAMALLVSGGHTELVAMSDWLSYELVGKTRDDAAGEAFDKVARLLGLPYPGGPQISKLAEKFSNEMTGAPTTIIYDSSRIRLPRPMLDSPDFDFSFSGLKTAVRYMIEKMPQPLSEETKAAVAHEFEESVVEVLLSKTLRAVREHGSKSLVVGGGVIANKKLRARLKETFAKELPEVRVYIPENLFTTDNATMIALSGYFSAQNGPVSGGQNRSVLPGTPEFDAIRASGTLAVHHG